ncbi:myocardin-related transcription factor A-like isoform X2 [Anabas testudineus]|uniref:myocardin-related transcription factor A-like isoform X2 n=1 Tax=Anabas testudineus TaxID=64144 RepID=UPI000E45E024|nr:myocardin-related transcription factor A-like isoform X2 [Anabas testudineus]
MPAGWIVAFHTVLQLKLQQRRSREDLLNQRIMPPLKSSATFHKQRRSLERAQTDDYLKRKLKSQPEQSELIRMHILAEASAEASLQARQLQLKRARLAADLNDEVSALQLGPADLLPVDSSIKQTFKETQFKKPSCYKDSNETVSPEQSGSRPLGLGPVFFPETLSGSTVLSPAQATSGTQGPAQRISASSQIKSKPNTDRSAQRQKKPLDNGPKIKKLKYHQYIAPDRKEDKEPPPHLDSSYSKILQQQQLFLQLQILSQQQHNYDYNSALCAPPRPQKDQLDEMKVADLKFELKLRSLPVYGTKNDLIERLRTYEELSGGSDTTSSPTAGGTTVPGAEGAGKSSSTAAAINNTTSQRQQTSSLKRHSGGSTTSSTAAQRLMTCSGTVSLPPTSVISSDNLPEDTTFNSNPVGQMLSFQPCLAAQVPTDIKEESLAPWQVSLKPAALQKHYSSSSTTRTSTAAAPVLAVDKDKMLREKDKQIEELTRMLERKQKLVEVLKMQLERGKRGEQGQDPEVVVRVKQEPPDEHCVPPSYDPLTLPLSSSPTSCKMDVTKVTVKQEPAEEAVSETTLQSPGRDHRFLSQEVQRQILLQIKPEHTSATTKDEQHVCFQHNIQNQQLQLKQQTAPLKQQMKRQQPSKQQQKIQIQINLKQQQVLIEKTPQMKHQSPQLQKQPGSPPSFPLDLLKTDSNNNHFPIALTNRVTDSQRANTPEATNDITLQNGRFQAPVDQQQGAAQSFESAPPSLRRLLKDQETMPSGKNTISSQTEVCSSLDVLFSPLSPASPSSDNKGTEDDFIDMILQTGEMPTKSTPAPDLSVDCLFPNSPALSPSITPSCDSAHPALIMQSELERLVDTTEEKQHCANAGSGRLEDFLESTTGMPLLGVEHGGLLALIDDLHNQMLCSPSILDHPPSPMDTFDRVADVQQGLDINDWLDLTVVGETEEETPPSGPQTPCGIFSTDFLESCLIL